MGGVLQDIAFNNHNNRLYVAGDWRNQLSLDGMPVVTNMDSIWSAAMFVAAMDTSLTTTHLVTLRAGDTLNNRREIVQLADLEVDRRGHVLATGTFTDSFLVNNTLFHARSAPNPNAAEDVLVVDFTPTLALDTLYMSEGSGYEASAKVVAGKAGEMYVSGIFNGPCAFPPYSAVSTTAPPEWVIDAFCTRLKWASGPAGVSALNVAPSVLYPNPTHTEVRIALANMQGIKVIALDGRIMEQRSLPAGTSSYSLSVANWPAGFYLVQIRDSAGNIHSSKLSKQ